MVQASDAELEVLLTDLESHRVERTVSFEKGDKFREAICAFANDLPNTGHPGYLFVGVTDDGKWSGKAVTDQLLLSLTSIRSEGLILPSPRMSVEKRLIGGGEVAVVEVFPSDMPPVRYKGRVWVRIGPRKDTATEAEERVLMERRSAVMSRPWDARPALEAKVDDITLDMFATTYRIAAVEASIIADDHRPIEHQLAAFRLFDIRAGVPTNAGVLLFGQDPQFFYPGAYVQYVHYDGTDQASQVLRQRQFAGDLLTVMRGLDTLAEDIAVERPVEDGVRDRTVSSYPARAMHEIFMNGVVHRNYESTTPLMISHFSDRIEVLSPGGLYGDLTPEQFPHGTAYRNPIIAEAARVLGFVNRFGRGIDLAQDLLARNGSAPAIFEFQPTFFLATVRSRP
jgi:ATP-dependent DNA helicase RecG